MDVKMKRKSKRNTKRAQVTIFIIIALIIVVSIVLIYVIWRKPSVSLQPETNPSMYIESCVKDSVEETLGILMPQGGYINPVHFKLHNNEKIAYLCYGEMYLPCINQEPLLTEHLKQEISKDIEPKVQGCFNILESELENKGYSITLKEGNLTTELQTGKVVVNIERELTITKNKEIKVYRQFKTEILSPIYEISKIVLKIVNSESVDCYFTHDASNLIYHEYLIHRNTMGDGMTEIYSIKDKKTEKEFKFAVRGCAIPPPGA